MEISAILYSLIKAIPAVRDIFLKIQEMRQAEIITQIDIFHVKKQDKKSLLLFKIEKAQTNEEKIILFSTYNDIDRLPDN
jgi:predicted transcriptional regulator